MKDSTVKIGTFPFSHPTQAEEVIVTYLTNYNNALLVDIWLLINEINNEPKIRKNNGILPC